MNKELINLQRNSKATCAIIKNEESNKLSPAVVMKASVSDKFLLAPDRPPFADKVDNKSKTNEICYFVITGLDEISTQQQDRYIGLVKDRELNGYYLPNNVIIVFTVEDEETLKKISPNLYHFSVVAF